MVVGVGTTIVIKQCWVPVSVRVDILPVANSFGRDDEGVERFRKVVHCERVGWKHERWIDVAYWQLQLSEGETAPSPFRA